MTQGKTNRINFKCRTPRMGPYLKNRFGLTLQNKTQHERVVALRAWRLGMTITQYKSKAGLSM